MKSRHALLLLGNTGLNFKGLKSLESIANRGIYYTRGNNDVAILTQADLYETIKKASQTEGLFSSRTLILTDTLHEEEARKAENYGFLLINGLYGQEDSVARQLEEVEELYALYSAKGIYGLAGLVSFDNEEELKERVNRINGIRHATLNRTERPISPIAPVEEDQVIKGQGYDSRNKYETDYENDSEVNIDYARGAIQMANHIRNIVARSGPLTMIYAPLRGAKPITAAMLEAFRRIEDPDQRDYFQPHVHFPVTSSFVSYPKNHPYVSKKGKKPASGRFTNILELRRLPLKNLERIQHILYVDEIVSGGMMQGHIKEMVNPRGNRVTEGILRDLVAAGRVKLSVFGLADANAEKFGQRKKNYLYGLADSKWIDLGVYPIPNLITEDQRFLLGEHYLENQLGPNSIPFMTQSRDYRPEYHEFWRDVTQEMDSFISRED